MAKGIYKRVKPVSEKVRELSRQKMIKLNKENNPMKRPEVVAKSIQSRLGKKHSEETKRKIGLKSKGRTYNHTNETKIKISSVKQGITVKEWTNFKTSNDRIERKSKKYKIWRMSVFLRDNFTCQCCGRRGCYLEAHHIKRFVDYPELRYELNNGVTLCLECHNQTKRILK